jgi:hypothetical protein
MSQIRQGRLLDDARAYVSGHSYLLRVEFSPPSTGHGKPRRYVAIKDYGQGAAASIVTARMASTLRRGVLVRVQAATEDDRRGRSVLEGVERIEAPDMPPPTRFLAKDDQ